MLDIDEAMSQLVARSQPVTDIEHVPLTELPGRVAAHAIRSTLDTPPYRTSAMDGYAVASCDTAASGSITMKISQAVSAGDTATRLSRGTAARILTGAPMPEGADTVIVQENCRVEDNVITFQGPVAADMNVRHAGEDITAGDTVLAAGVAITPRHLALLASVGIETVPVYRRVRVAIASTGNELVMPGQELTAGKIYNSNHYCLLGQLQQTGCDVIDLGILPDDIDAICSRLEIAARDADLVVTSGGVSIGDKDLIRQSIQTLGKLEMWKIAIKPGKPFAFGSIGHIPVIGLPGNPVSQFVTFNLLARPFILRTQGRHSISPPSVWARSLFTHDNKGTRQEYLRARFEADDAGRNLVTKFDRQGSAILSSLTWANCLAVVPPRSTVSRDQAIRIIPFCGFQE